MNTDAYRCGCTNAAADICTAPDPIEGRDGDICLCICHVEYAEDPENWQPLCIPDVPSAVEVAEMTDWLERMDVAEALIEEPES